MTDTQLDLKELNFLAAWLFANLQATNDIEKLLATRDIAMASATLLENQEKASLLTDIGLCAEHKTWSLQGQPNNFAEIYQTLQNKLANI